jgi:hypothetical protein
MPKIILPFDSEERSIQVAGWGLVTLKAYQILVFVSITEQGCFRVPGATPIVPALFDTGNSLGFTLSEAQLGAAKPWGMRFAELNKQYSIRHSLGMVLLARAVLADVWLYDYSYNDPPPPQGHDQSSQRDLIKLSMALDGIACVPSQQPDRPAMKGRDTSLKALSQTMRRWFGIPAGAQERQQGPQAVGRRGSVKTDRLSLPHLPLLGLRALCLNSLRADLVCNPRGGSLTIVTS